MADHPGRRATDRPRWRVTALGAAISLALLVIAVIASFVFAPPDKSTPLVAALVGFAGPAFIALLALAKTERVDHNVDALRHEVRHGNGNDTAGGG